MKSSPIYTKVSIEDRKTSPSFGAGKSGYTQTILVGTSAKYSSTFAEIEVKQDSHGDVFLFVDGKLIKKAFMSENGREIERFAEV